jgi:hypothetical protein
MLLFFAGEILVPLGIIGLKAAREKRQLERFRTTKFLVRTGAPTQDIIEEIQRLGGTVVVPSGTQVAAMGKNEVPPMTNGFIAIFGVTWLRGRKYRPVPFIPFHRWKNETIVRFQVRTGENNQPLIAENEASTDKRFAKNLVHNMLRRL